MGIYGLPWKSEVFRNREEKNTDQVRSHPVPAYFSHLPPGIAFDMVEDQDGSLVITGQSYYYNNHSFDYLLLKLDAVGNVIWLRSYGGGSHESAYCLCMAHDGGYIIASSGFWIAKMNSEGDTLWSYSYGGEESFAYDLVPVHNSGFMVVGSLDVIGPGSQICVLKINSNGDSLWMKLYGSTGYDQGYSIAETSSADYVIAGLTSIAYHDAFLMKIEGQDIQPAFVFGTVTDASSGNVLSDVDVQLLQDDIIVYETLTNDEGYYELNPVPGTYDLKFNKENYNSLSIMIYC